VIELIDVYAELGGEWVLRGVSFAAEAGRITAILGPSGVGKTTTLRLVLGLLEPDAGDILIDGRSRLQLRKKDRLSLAKRFGVLLQGSGLYGSALWDSMTVRDNVTYQLRALRDLDERTLRRRTREVLREVGLADSADLMPDQLSAGMRRRAALARALVSEPELVILDSFELGVDVVRLRGLCNLIARHHAEHGGTYLIATQSMYVAQLLADEIVVLWGGRVIEDGPADEVLDSLQPEVRQLVSGETEGPLGLASEGGRPARVPMHPTEQDLDVPVALAAAILLIVITASVLWLGGAHVAELGVTAGAWMVGAVLLIRRYRRAR
jgi:phospholipid/cholesterol/gamma-HCH transport system ATP-binding protein